MRAEGLTKSFRSGSEEVVVLEDLSVEVQAGEFMALVGESGSGKTTLLHLLAALDTPTKGEVYFEGRRLSEYREDERALYRNEKIGFVWQMHYLLPEFSALENVVIPQLIRGCGMSEARGAPENCWGKSGLKTHPNAVWVNYRAGSNREWPWPAHLPISLPFYWQTSPQEVWTIVRRSA